MVCVEVILDTFSASIIEAFWEGPKQGMPCNFIKSVIPFTKGCSGPTTAIPTYLGKPDRNSIS